MTYQQGLDGGLDHAPLAIWLHDPNSDPPNTRLTIAELAARVCKKDHEAFEMLYKHYQKPLGKHLMSFVYDKEVVADLYQDTFERVWKTISQKITHFQPWLYTIAANLAHDYLRHKKLINFLPLLESDEYTRFAELRVEGDEGRICDLLCLQEAVAMMTPQYRACLVLQHYWGFTQREIASILHISESAVSTNVSRGYRQLHKHQFTLMAALQRAEAECDAQARDRPRQGYPGRGGAAGYGPSSADKRRRIRNLLLQPHITKGLPPRLQQLLQNEGHNSE